MQQDKVVIKRKCQVCNQFKKKCVCIQDKQNEEVKEQQQTCYDLDKQDNITEEVENVESIEIEVNRLRQDLKEDMQMILSDYRQCLINYDRYPEEVKQQDLTQQNNYFLIQKCQKKEEEIKFFYNMDECTLYKSVNDQNAIKQKLYVDCYIKCNYLFQTGEKQRKKQSTCEGKSMDIFQHLQEQEQQE